MTPPVDFQGKISRGKHTATSSSSLPNAFAQSALDSDSHRPLSLPSPRVYLRSSPFKGGESFRGTSRIIDPIGTVNWSRNIVPPVGI